MTVRITDSDRGMDRLLRKMRAQQPRAAVGIMGSGKSYDGGATVLQVASAHEFGGPRGKNGRPRPPKRSWLRDTVDMRRANIDRALRVVGRNVIAGDDETRQMKRFGLYVEGLIKERISDGIMPPLAEVTIARKGSSKPLIDTGQMRNAVMSEVRR